MIGEADIRESSNYRVGVCYVFGVPAPQYESDVPIVHLCIENTNTHIVPEHLANQKIKNWVEPVSDEDTEDAVGLRVYVCCLLPAE